MTRIWFAAGPAVGPDAALLDVWTRSVNEMFMSDPHEGSFVCFLKIILEYIFPAHLSKTRPGYSSSIVSYKHLLKNALQGGNTKLDPSISLFPTPVSSLLSSSA